MSDPNRREQRAYWEEAGQKGYANSMFVNSDVENHVSIRHWETAIEIGQRLGMTKESHVLDLGCGDGTFANRALANHFFAVDGFDFSESGIRHAQVNAPREGLRYEVRDIVNMNFAELPRYDGVFLIGFLHHVKKAAPSIVRALRGSTDRIVVMEPNGNNLLRKLAEFTPTYRAAGEDSFQTNELIRMFESAKFRMVTWRRMNLFPNFTPRFAYRVLAPIEPHIEASTFWNALCTVNMFGFAADGSA